MSPAEAAFRGLEQVRRLTDRLRRPGWRGGFTGAICGLPGLERSKTGDVVFDEQVRAEASAALAGRFAFFGQTWPTDGRETWWLGDIWRLDPVTGAFWPGTERCCHDIDYRGVAGSDGPQRGDVKFVWELNRLQFLPVIALDAARRGEPDATERIFHVLKGWMANNPPYRGVNWTGGIEAASRVISLLAALAFVRPETAEDEAAVRLFLKAHVHWILRHPSRFSSSNNHRVAELTALVVAALCAPDLSRAGGLFRRAKAGLELEMLRQFHEDGVGAEQSVHYAAYSLEWFMLAGFACDVAGSPMSAGFKARTRRVLDHLLWAIDTGGRALRTGDDDAARVLALTQAPEPRYAASVADLTARWLGCAGPAPETRDVALRDLIGRPVPIAEPPVGRRTFPHGGLTVWRRPVSGAPMLLAFDHGPLGHLSIAAHGHADALSVWLYWGEEAIFTGAGTYLYHGDGALRDALRGTAAHNTLTLKGQEQSRILGPFAWGRAARTTLLCATDNAVEAEHDGYRRRFGLIHRRRVLVENDNVAIEDDIMGSLPQRTPWSLGFTLAPGVAVRLCGPRAMLRTQAGRRLVLIGEALEGQPLSWTCVETPYAETFGDLRRTFRLILSGDGRTTPAVRTQILFSPTGDHQDSP